jgi:hypothetical protein
MAYQPKKIVLCTVCGQLAIARRLCRSHYNAAQASKSLVLHSKLGPEDVFDTRYKIMPSGCWEWIGSKNDFGYGLLLIDKVQIRAHRYSYERSKGPIPRGLVIMHSCDNPPCVNPDHLSLGTRLENNRDAAHKGRTPSGSRHWNYKGP